MLGDLRLRRRHFYNDLFVVDRATLVYVLQTFQLDVLIPSQVLMCLPPWVVEVLVEYYN